MSDQPPDLSEQEIAALVARCPAESRALFEGWLRGTHHLDGERINDGEPEMSQVAERIEQQHVRVWFGQHVIAQYVAEPELAARYAEAMGKRFAGLKITTDPVPARPDGAQPLPSDRLWGNTPH